MHACDRQTDRILIARPRLRSMQRGKNVGFGLGFRACVFVILS